MKTDNQQVYRYVRVDDGLPPEEDKRLAVIAIGIIVIAICIGILITR